MSDTSKFKLSEAKPDLSPKRLQKRYRAEARFRLYGITAIVFAIGVLGILLGSIISSGTSAFIQTEIALDINFDANIVDPEGTRSKESFLEGNYRKLWRDSLFTLFPEVKGRKQKKALSKLISRGADLTLREKVINDSSIIGTTKRIWVKSSADIDSLNKGKISRSTIESDRRVKNHQIAWFDKLIDENRERLAFNSSLFTAGDSREPEQAGIGGAVVGSFLTLIVTLLLSFPIGVMAAVYLESFAPKNRWTDIIEVNINNLAAVPSIVFGLLGLAIFLNFFGMPRSAPIVGGTVLALMTLPTIIIAGRAALKAVPPSIQEAALAMGASRLQAVSHHVLPLAMPGILTGTIIGMARALGETAPLLMIGMVAFIVDIPRGLSDPSTVLPVQIYLWADAPERAFAEKTSAAIMVLLLFLILMNLAAVILRKKFEKRW
tara:strand:+ start:4518 stop:5822 length:1305 start_codon:yes stop_codon:yes gene_type:complete